MVSINHSKTNSLRNEIDNQYFHDLFQRYLSGHCTVEETNLLLQIFDLSDKEQLQEHVVKAFQTGEDSPPTAEEKDLMSAMFAGVQRSIATRENTHLVYKILRWSAAAVFLIFIGLGGILLWSRGRHSSQDLTDSGHQLVVKEPEKIVPGHSGATLRLSGGKTILLDSMANGVQLTQGKVQITKKNGELIYQGGDDKLAYNTISTDRGQEWHLILPDGTKVWLNAATTITFPTSFDKLPFRTIELQGEAYFEVAENKDKPFSVHTVAQEIKDIGTHFNVSCYGDDPSSKTTLLEGSVQINGQNILRPGQQAATGPEGKTVVSNADLEAAIAWKNGSFDFNDNDIHDIMRKVARWYNVDVVYRGMIPTEKLEGSISRFDDVSRLISIIQKTGLVQIAVTGKTIYIDGK
jgi:transmembrane sensor